MPLNHLYIHVPFCSGKCFYCDFFSLNAPKLIPVWFTAIQKELALYADRLGQLDTIYFGGGTPSLLEPEIIAKLTDKIGEATEIGSNAEITLEANPEDVSPRKAEAWLTAGINRISLGVQSLDDRELAFLGRRHSAQDSLAAIDTLRRTGFRNLSLDFIYGLPGQALRSWEDTLARAADISPEHLSCYQLTIEPGTRLGRLSEKGEVEPIGPEQAREFFLTTRKSLRKHGYKGYEVSNFARTPEHASRHNSAYWTHRPYLGLGPAAHSFDGRARWWNPDSINRYGELFESGEGPAPDREELTAEDLRLEEVGLGLRTLTGVRLATIEALANGPAHLRTILDQALGVLAEDRLVLTDQGLAVADGLIGLLVGGD